MKLNQIRTVVLLTLAVCNFDSTNGQIGEGPIPSTSVTAYCQNIPGQYPFYSPDWFYGEWQLTGFFSSYEATTDSSNCAYADIQLVDGQTVFKTRRTFQGVTESKTQSSSNTFENYLVGPAVWSLVSNGTHGLFQKTVKPTTTFGRVIVLSLSQADGNPSLRDKYLTALYIYCGHLVEGSPWGFSSIAEVGILTRDGSIPGYVLEHYTNLIEEYNLIPSGQTLQMYSHASC